MWSPKKGPPGSTYRRPGQKRKTRSGWAGSMERRVRKVTVYVCTKCYAGYPSKGEAQEHYDREHHEPAPRRSPGRPPKKS